MVVVSAYVQAHWLRLCETIGAPELGGDPRFATNELRVANRPAMKEAVGAQLARLGTRECVELLTRNNIVVGVVRSYADVLAGEDFRASGMVVEAATNGSQAGYTTFGLPQQALCDTPRQATQAAPGRAPLPANSPSKHNSISPHQISLFESLKKLTMGSNPI